MKKWVRVSLFYFTIIALIGAYIRLTFAGLIPSIDLNIGHLIHAHSHVAFQGWLYPILTFLLVDKFLGVKTLESKKYKTYFLLSHSLIPLILISFSIQGYALFSILFSTLFQFVNYAYIASYLRDSNKLKPLPSLSIAKWSLMMLFISTLGPWFVAIVSATLGKTHQFYHAAIYFYMHFQYNGFFLFALLAIVMRIFEQKGISFSPKTFVRFKYTLITGTVLSYFLSVIGLDYFEKFRLIGLLGGGVLLLNLIVSIPYFVRLRNNIEQSFLLQIVSGIALLIFIAKPVLQTLSGLPPLSDLALNNRYIIMGFMHLILPGMISLALLWILFQEKLLSFKKLDKIGTFSFVIGLIISEILLFGIGINLFENPLKVLALASFFMPLGLSITLSNQFINKT